jgi:hypothetical protein
MHEQLCRAWADFRDDDETDDESDDETDDEILTGAGDDFCSGALLRRGPRDVRADQLCRCLAESGA